MLVIICQSPNLQTPPSAGSLAVPHPPGLRPPRDEDFGRDPGLLTGHLRSAPYRGFPDAVVGCAR